MSTTNTNVFTFLETIILDKAKHKSSVSQRNCATLVTRLMDYTDQVPNIFHALLWAGVNNHNANIAIEQEAAASLQPAPKPTVYDISYAGFLQRLMDTATREMYKITQSRKEATITEEVNLGGTGVDWTQDRADEVGIDSSSLALLRVQIDELFIDLRNVQILFTTAVELDNIEVLSMYAPSVQGEDGEWDVPFKTDDFSEACDAITVSDAEYAANRGSKVVDMKLYSLSDLPGATKITEQVAPASSEPDFVDDAMPF